MGNFELKMGLFMKLFGWGPYINLFVEGYLQFFGWVHSSKAIGRGACIKIFGVIYQKSLSWRMPIGITRGVMLRPLSQEIVNFTIDDF